MRLYMRYRGLLLGGIIFSAMAGCSQVDDNATPRYGETGLPANCRAYIQSAINDYRAKKYTADDTFNAIERNCGVAGHTWKDLRS
jgi:hypothetical protein